MKGKSNIPETNRYSSLKSLNLSQYKVSSLPKAVWQILNSVIPYAILWGLMVYLIRHDYPYWITLSLSVPAAALLVRIFIIFHDCCHQSFFAASGINTLWGHFLGILIFTPYEEWKALHLKHHGTTSNLDLRGMGDIWTMTVKEYLASSRTKKVLYRIFRNPLVMLSIGPVFYFLISQRIWHSQASNKQKLSVLSTSFFILAIILISYFTIGLSTYLVIQIPIILIAGAIGLWLFYIQHQFEGVYWARQEDWDSTRAAIEGSSFYKLPKVLQWVSGNIGFHHIHHIRPLIPNYNLQRCYSEVPELQAVQTITLRKSLSSLFLNLWNEQQQKLVSFRSLQNSRNA